jgi:ribosomal protein S27AE
MYCSTCGAFVAEHRERCTECGTPVRRDRLGETRPVARYGREDRRYVLERSIGVCPRCSYQGEGISYFSRGIHALALAGITLMTGAAMGAGGLIYFLMRREHRVCPRCGMSWGRHGEQSLRPTRAGATVMRIASRVPSPAYESTRRTWSVVLLVVAVMLLIGGIATAEFSALAFGAAAGAGGWLLHRSANQAREERRAALIAELQLEVLRLARERGGRLTVTEVAAALDWPLRRAEKVLISLDDGLRVDSEVSDEGVIVYEFREVLHSRRRLAGREESPPQLEA